MPAQYVLSGSDTLQIQGRTITSVCSGDWAKLTFPNETTQMDIGKNGNTVYAYDFRGEQAQFELMLLRGTDDDAFLQSLFVPMRQDFASFLLLQGQYIKRLGDGAGNLRREIAKLQGGVFSKRIETMSNAQGEPKQAIALWTMKWARAIRVFM
jgi:hypothetical protein